MVMPYYYLYLVSYQRWGIVPYLKLLILGIVLGIVYGKVCDYQCTKFL